jgi:hypothetical protein
MTESYEPYLAEPAPAKAGGRATEGNIALRHCSGPRAHRTGEGALMVFRRFAADLDTDKAFA